MKEFVQPCVLSTTCRTKNKLKRNKMRSTLYYKTYEAVWLKFYKEGTSRVLDSRAKFQ